MYFDIKRKIVLKIIIVISVFMLFQQHTDKKTYYEVLSEKSVERIDQKIAEIEKAATSSIKNAYLGGLYMKKSSFLKKPKDKLDMFNKGKNLLENEITRNPNNAEYRFIRLILQEHSPIMLKYNTNIEDDKQFIEKKFSTLDKDLQGIIKEYASTSKILSVNLLR